jgi:hypothetical protein
MPTHALVCPDDRLFPADWMRGVVRDRLGIDAEEIRSARIGSTLIPRLSPRCLTVTRGVG